MSKKNKPKKSNTNTTKKISETGVKIELTTDTPVVFKDPTEFLKTYKSLSVEDLFATTTGLNSKYVEKDFGFPLRKHCPDATKFLMQNLKVPNHQRRALAPILQLRTQRIVDVKDDHEFFESVLDVLEHTPSFLILMTLSITEKLPKHTSTIEEVEDFYAEEFVFVDLVKSTRKNYVALESKFKKNGEKALTTADMTRLFLSYCFYLGVCSAQSILPCEIESDIGSEVYDVEKREFKLPDLGSHSISGSEKERLVISEKLIVLARRLMRTYNQEDFDELQVTIEQLNAWESAIKKNGEKNATK